VWLQKNFTPGALTELFLVRPELII